MNGRPVEMPTVTDLFSLKGRVALVTGASRGLGRAIAVGLAEAGADVACASTHRDGTAETAASIAASGRRSWQFSADLSSPGAAQHLVNEVEEHVGGVDILVNNAGIIRRHPATDFPLEDWKAVLSTNLDAVFQLCQGFGRGMIERGSGKIINVASLLAFSGGITVPAYTASKHAVAGLTKALANEWATHNIQVNAIAPGYFRTDNTKALQDNQVRAQEITARIPAGRWGEPSDLAGAAVFLAARAGDYVNGHILVVDGGWMAR